MRLIDADELKKALRQRQWHIDDIEEVEKIIDNAPTVELNDKSLEIARKSIELGRSVGKLEGKLERPQGECENCDFRKFSEKFIDGVVEVMNKNGITSVEQLSEILQGGAE